MQRSNFLLVQGLAQAGVEVHLQVFTAHPGMSDESPAVSTEVHRIDVTGVSRHLACARAIRRRARELRPDVVLLLDDAVVRALGFLPFVHKSGQRFASVNSGSVLTRTNAHWRGRASALFVKRGYRWLDRIFVADATAVELRAAFSDIAGRVRVLGRPIPDAFYGQNGTTKAALFDNGLPTLFSCSRADEQKGVQLILRALGALRDAAGGEIANFVYAGSGPALEGWRRLASSLDLNNVTFAGAVPFEAIQEYYASCDVCIFPTLYPDETFGRTWVEAFANGKPVISTHINNLKYLVQDGVNGIVVRPDVQDVAAGIRRALALGADDVSRMSERARATALPYKQSIVVRTLLNSLNELT
jgi:glycosyltransferase involved in cell wall biosynthesis